MKNVHLISLGCSKNLVDSERMLGVLRDINVHYTANAETSDAIIINTCAFLQSAVDESMQTIQQALQLKQQGKTKHVIVTGCLPQRYRGNLETQLPLVDLFLGTSNFHRIQSYFQSLQPQPTLKVTNPIPDPDYTYDHTMPRLQATLPHTAYLKISEGCSRTCTFCIIPQLRGDLRSRTIDSLMQEATQLVQQGVIELNLIAQDLTAYGKDLKPRQTLNDLLNSLCSITDLQWIRLHYAYPHGFDDQLIETINRQPKICNYLDMPLQHIDHDLLRQMKRQTTENAIRDLLPKLRQRIDNLSLRTTLIVGFPGESEAAFNKLHDFVSEQRFQHLGVFTYSQEPGTPAATMDQQLDEQTKISRQETIMKTQQEISLQHHQKMVGKTVTALIEKQIKANNKDYSYFARLSSQAPEVDGRTIVTAQNPLQVGQLVQVKIEGASHYDLYAYAA